VTAVRTFEGSSGVPASLANMRPWSTYDGPAASRSAACAERWARSSGRRDAGSWIVLRPARDFFTGPRISWIVLRPARDFFTGPRIRSCPLPFLRGVRFIDVVTESVPASRSRSDQSSPVASPGAEADDHHRRQHYAEPMSLGGGDQRLGLVVGQRPWFGGRSARRHDR
jgi:hypothetical protein